MPMKLRVFLSYASQDRVAVEVVYDALRIAGFEPWMDDHSLAPGDRWEAEIRSGLNAADVLCIFLSRSGVSEPSRYFVREYRLGLKVMAERGQDRPRTPRWSRRPSRWHRRSPSPASTPATSSAQDRSAVIPVRLDHCSIPPELSEFQIVDLQGEFETDRLETGLRKVARRLGRHVEPLLEWHLKRARRYLSQGDINQALLEADAAVDIGCGSSEVMQCEAI
jgi:hypothetical protein